jgi:predicted nucleic acid-binding protein
LEALKLQQGKIVELDTAPLIYLIEEHPIYLDVVTPFFKAVERGEFRFVTSIITLVEVLVYPIKHNDVKLAQKYRDLLFDTEGLDTIAFLPEIAEKAADLRAFHKMFTPDAIQIATATHTGASYFLTMTNNYLLSLVYKYLC